MSLAQGLSKTYQNYFYGPGCFLPKLLSFPLSLIGIRLTSQCDIFSSTLTGISSNKSLGICFLRTLTNSELVISICVRQCFLEEEIIDLRSGEITFQEDSIKCKDLAKASICLACSRYREKANELECVEWAGDFWEGNSEREVGANHVRSYRLWWRSWIKYDRKPVEHFKQVNNMVWERRYFLQLCTLQTYSVFLWRKQWFLEVSLSQADPASACVLATTTSPSFVSLGQGKKKVSFDPGDWESWEKSTTMTLPKGFLLLILFLTSSLGKQFQIGQCVYY